MITLIFSALKYRAGRAQEPSEKWNIFVANSSHLLLIKIKILSNSVSFFVFFAVLHSRECRKKMNSIAKLPLVRQSILPIISLTILKLQESWNINRRFRVLKASRDSAIYLHRIFEFGWLNRLSDKLSPRTDSPHIVSMFSLLTNSSKIVPQSLTR